MIRNDDILNSGSIEAHVLAVSSNEDSELINSLNTSEVRTALAESETILEDLALHQAVKLPDDFKQRIKAKLEIKNDQVPNVGEANNFVLWRNISMAASFAALLSIGTNIYLSQKVNSTESALQLAQQQSLRLASEAGFIKEKQIESQSQLNVLLSERKKTIVLKGQAFSPQSKATVYWSGDEVYLFANNFPLNNQETQYQLWAIVEGVPVDAGVFDVKGNTDGLIRLKNISNASAFAVTIEKRGGSKTPTLEKMIVLGTV